MAQNSVVSSLFSKWHSTSLSELTLNSVQRVQWWVEQQFKFSSKFYVGLITERSSRSLGATCIGLPMALLALCWSLQWPPLPPDLWAEAAEVGIGSEGGMPLQFPPLPPLQQGWHLGCILNQVRLPDQASKRGRRFLQVRKHPLP